MAQKIQQFSIHFGLFKQCNIYLGIKISCTLSSFIENIFAPKIANVKSDFRYWSCLPLSLSGKVQCVKINILTECLHVFQCLSLFLPKSFWVRQSLHLLRRKRFLESAKPYCRDRGTATVSRFLISCITTGLSTYINLFTGQKALRLTDVA